jgi:hypothetical protein
MATWADFPADGSRMVTSKYPGTSSLSSAELQHATSPLLPIRSPRPLYLAEPPASRRLSPRDPCATPGRTITAGRYSSPKTVLYRYNRNNSSRICPDDGIMIDSSARQQWKADRGIRFNSESERNKIERSEWQVKKHSSPRILREDRMTIDSRVSRPRKAAV